MEEGDLLAVLHDGEKIKSEVTGTVKLAKGVVVVIHEGDKIRESTSFRQAQR